METAGQQHGVISKEQAAEFGISTRTLRRRLASGEWVQVFRGAYRMAGFPTGFPQTMMAACLSVGPDAVASHHAVGALLEVPNVPRWVDLSVAGPRRAAAGMNLYSSLVLVPGHVGSIGPIPATTPARTLIDLAEVYDPERLGRALDCLMSRRMVNRAELEANTAFLRPYLRHAEVMDRLLAQRPHRGRPFGSEFESLLYGGLRDAGVPSPESQYPVAMPDGTVVYLDFAYPERKLALEADSYLWHASLKAWQKDRARNNELIALGWSILPVTWYHVRCRMPYVVHLVRRALASRG